MSISSSNSSPICFVHWESGSASGHRIPHASKATAHATHARHQSIRQQRVLTIVQKATEHLEPIAPKAHRRPPACPKAARPKATAPHRQIRRAAANAMLSPYEKRGVAIRATPRCIAYREQTEEAARPAPRERRRRCPRRSGRTCPAARVRDRTRRTHPAHPRDAWERGSSRTERRRRPLPIRR